MAEKNNKNGLIELLRFLCALWVAYFHGFSPIITEHFNGVIVPVDFFFAVTGFFFLRSVDKYLQRPIKEGLRFIFWDRIKRFAIPLAIAALSVLLCNILVEMDLGFNWPFSFLWFFAAQPVFLLLFYFLLRKLKKRAYFNIACVVIICLSMSFFRLEIRALDIFARGPGMLAFGMLISEIPKIKLNLTNRVFTNRLTLFINTVGFLVFAVAFIYLAYLPGYAVWKIHVLCCLVIPLLLYFATALPIRSRFLNFLGDFSLYIYLGQCPILLHHYFVSRDTKDQFPLLCICAVLLFVLNKYVNKKKLIK